MIVNIYIIYINHLNKVNINFKARLFASFILFYLKNI